MDPAKMSTLPKWPWPQNVKDAAPRRCLQHPYFKDDSLTHLTPIWFWQTIHPTN
jgi:hypothetical protein